MEKQFISITLATSTCRDGIMQSVVVRYQQVAFEGIYISRVDEQDFRGFGSWPQSATPHLWRRHKTKAVVWFLTQMWRGTVFSQEISSFFRHRCGAQIGRLSFGGATAMVWQSMAMNQTASNISN